MDNVEEYFKSFIRLDSSNQIKMDYNKFSSGKYLLKMVSRVNILPFLPHKIVNNVVQLHIEIKDMNDIDIIDISDFIQCDYINITGESKSNLSVVGNYEIQKLEVDKLECNALKLKQFVNLNHLKIKAQHLKNTFALIQDTLKVLHVQLSSTPIKLNLDKLTSLQDISIKGLQDKYDQLRFKAITFPSTLNSIEIKYLNMDEIDISQFNHVQSIILQTINQSDVVKRVRGSRIHWSDTIFYNLKEFKIYNITFNQVQVVFTGKYFPKLEVLNFESHMNSEVILIDLKHLRKITTDVDRFVIGHQLDLYLINLPNLKQSVTGHRIKKHIYQCPRIAEFNNETIILDSIPQEFENYTIGKTKG